MGNGRATCFSASVLVLVGDTADLLDRVVAKAKALAPGTEAVSGCSLT